MKYRVILAVIALFLTTWLIADANMNINLINNTEKSLEFAVSEPEGSTSTDSYPVKANNTYNFNLDDLLAKGCDQHKLCQQSKFWVVLEKWGDTTVYVRCPKMFNPKGSVTKLNLKVNGDDTSTLTCEMSSAKN